MDHKKKNILELTRCTVSEYQRKEKFPVSVLLENVRSGYNVGSVFRTADAFLINKIILSGISGIPPHPEIKKTALGAEECVEWEYVEDALGACEKMKSEGWKICVLEQAHNSILLQDFKTEIGERYLIVAGNEVEGVSQSIINMADYVIEIPQFGVKHSLNVSVSVGIALWQFVKRMIL